MTDERPVAGSMPDIDAWLDTLRNVFPEGLVEGLSADERAALLDLARIAAHRSHRSAAPITTFLAGVVVAGRPSSERLDVLQALARALDRPDA